MFDERLLAAEVATFDPALLDGAAARRLVDRYARMERLCAAGKALAARRVAECGAWRGGSDRSAAHWLARATGSTVGAAVSTLQSAEALASLPATEERFRSGALSETQVRQIATAATPESEERLLSVADDVTVLRERCREERMAAEPDAQAAIHRTRSLRHWTDADGAWCLRARLTAADGAVVSAALRPLEDQAFRAARAAGRREPAEAYAADALVALARGATPKAAVIRVVVDEAALRRGRAEPGERCEITGLGPVPVATVQQLWPSATVTALATRGADVTKVVHLGRQVTAAQRAALEVRDPECAVAGCHVTERLEIDHRSGWALTHRSELDDLVRLCHVHHRQKTYDGYRILGRPGAWRWEPP